MSMMDIKGARESLRVKRAFILEAIADCAEMIGDRASAREIDGAGYRRHAHVIQSSATVMARRLNELFANISADEILKEQQEAGSVVTITPESCILSCEDDEGDINSN